MKHSVFFSFALYLFSRLVKTVRLHVSNYMFGKINNGNQYFADEVLVSITKVIISSIVYISDSQSG